MERISLKQVFVLMCLSCLLITPHAYSESATFAVKDIISTEDLISALQSGGHIVYMRHGPTDHTQKDINQDNLANCKGQRNLSTQGREVVSAIGMKIKADEIPIGLVLSSPYCRARETAELTFGRFKIEDKLRFSIHKNEVESQELGQQLYQMMKNTTPSDNNDVFVGHTSNLRDGLGIWPKPEGAIAVFKKQEKQIVFKGLIPPEQWFK